MPLDGLLDLAVGASAQRLQQLVAVLEVVLVVVFLHARVPPSLARHHAHHGRRGGRVFWG